MYSSKIAITGFMCSGKTTVARALAQLLGCAASDLDEAIVLSDGRSVAGIIEQDGENAFRETETRVLGTMLSNNSDSVVSLGGGTWTVPENRRLLVEGGYRTVWLDARFELCWKRIQASGNRPLARSYDAARKRFDTRAPIYALADYRVVIKENEEVEETARRVALVLRDRENS